MMMIKPRPQSTFHCDDVTTVAPVPALHCRRRHPLVVVQLPNINLSPGTHVAAAECEKSDAFWNRTLVYDVNMIHVGV